MVIALNTMNNTDKWPTRIPDYCQICYNPIIDKFVHGKTKHGYLASMCPICHSVYGQGIGEGRGEEYEVMEVKHAKV